MEGLVIVAPLILLGPFSLTALCRYFDLTSGQASISAHGQCEQVDSNPKWSTDLCNWSDYPISWELEHAEGPCR